MSIHPALALLAVFALPTVLTSTWRPGVERAAEEQGARRNPAGAAPVLTGHDGAAGQGGAGDGHRRSPGGERREAWERWYGPVAAAPVESALWHALAWAVFGAGFVGAVVFVVVGSIGTHAATCCWCWRRARGCRPTSAPRWARSAFCAASGSTARCAWRGSRITPPAGASTPMRPCPSDCKTAFASSTSRSPIPGPTGCVLEDVNLHLEPGSVVAIVGENGAGKTTLVKLLCRLYQPHERADPGRRRRARADAPRRLAVAARRRVSGLLPVRVPGAPHSRRR